MKLSLRQAWYRQENQWIFVGSLLGLALLLGIGLGIARGLLVYEMPTAYLPSQDELTAVIEARVQQVITDFYPWVLEGPVQVVMVEPPTAPLPQPTEKRPEPEPPLSFEHLIWPVQGEISTPFGWYRHPVYGDWRFNAGLEFQTSGDTVRTVLPGEVVAVTSSGLETELVISHGSGWSSTYRSIRGISVAPGEMVQQNQTIALPERDGLVFFGLTHNGEPVNPQAFLR